MSENEHEEDDLEVPDIERLRNIPIVNPEEPFHEILTELKRILRDGNDGGNKNINTKLDYQKPKHPISEYVSFRDETNDKCWGIVIYARPFLDLARSVINQTGVTLEVAEIHLQRYFVQRETFHFYVDRAVYAIENAFGLLTANTHGLWKKQCGKRLYKYSPHEITAAEFFSWQTKAPGAAKIFDFLIKVDHLSKKSTDIQSKYGTHRELNSWVLSDYLKSGCFIDDRIVGIENLLGLDNEGLGGVPSIKLSKTDKRMQPTRLPVRLYS